MNFKFKKTILSLVMALNVTSSTALADATNSITIRGSIVNADFPCSLSHENSDQAVSLTESGEMKQGMSAPKTFSIKLNNCVKSTLDSVTATFTGKELAENNALLATAGQEENVGIALKNGDGEVIKMSNIPEANLVVSHDNSVNLTANLQHAEQETSIPTGDYTAITQLTLAYH